VRNVVIIIIIIINIIYYYKYYYLLLFIIYYLLLLLFSCPEVLRSPKVLDIVYCLLFIIITHIAEHE